MKSDVMLRDLLQNMQFTIEYKTQNVIFSTHILVVLKLTLLTSKRKHDEMFAVLEVLVKVLVRPKPLQINPCLVIFERTV